VSTHIGYAFRFNDGISLDAAIELCWNLRPRMRKAQLDKLAKNFAQIAETKLIDKLRFGRQDKRTPLNYAIDAWRAAQKETEPHRRYSWDVQADVMLYRIGPATQQIILGKSLTGSGVFHNLIMRNLPVKDYHYQNQTDKPSHISNDKWALRASHWAEALPGLGVPMDHGIMVRLGYSEPPWPEMKAILRYLGVEAMIERQAKRLVVNDRASAIGAARSTTKRMGGTFTSVLRVHEDAVAWSKTDEGQRAILEEQARLRAVLPAKITKDDL
jgi:hypothetical protein